MISRNMADPVVSIFLVSKRKPVIKWKDVQIYKVLCGKGKENGMQRKKVLFLPGRLQKSMGSTKQYLTAIWGQG